MNEVNACFSIDYWVSNDKDITLKVNYNIQNETTADTILKIRPKSNEIENTNFCLRDLIVLNAKNYLISFNVEQYNDRDNSISFLLRIEDPENTVINDIWSFEDQTQTFLQNTQNYNQTEWTVISPNNTVSELFQFKENSIHFTGMHFR